MDQTAFYSRSSSFVLAVGLAALAWSILTQDRLHFYDERAYLGNVELLEKHGFSKEFLLEYFGSAGPLFPAVHYLLKPVTRMSSPGLQVVNLVFLGGIMWILGLILKRGNADSARYAPLLLLAFPMMYVCTGMVLTEIPAMFFLVLSFWLLLKWQECVKPMNPLAWFWLISAGFSFCLAILGRQIYLALIPILWVLILPAWPSRPKQWISSWFPLFLFSLASLFLPGVVFYVWQGLTGIFDAAIYAEIEDRGISLVPAFVILSLGYMGIVSLLVAPRLYEVLFLTRYRRWMIGLALSLGLANLSLGAFEHIALEGIAYRLLPDVSIPIYSRAVGTGLILLASAFVAATVIHGWKFRSDRIFLVAVLACLAIALTSLKITAQFSSRYVAQAAPFLLIILERFPTKGLWGPLGKAMGVGLGLAALYSFLSRE